MTHHIILTFVAFVISALCGFVMIPQIMNFCKSKLKQKLQLENKLKAFDKTLAERNQIETAKREEQSAFLRQQNENLDKFLKSIDGGKS